MGLRMYAMPPFLRGTPVVGPDGRGIPAKNSRAERGVRHCFQVDCGLSPLYASARLEYGLYF